MKDFKDKKTCEVRKKTSIGGQALIEGIMMRGPKKTAMAVRDPKGRIILEECETKGVRRPKICRLPIIRGIFGYIDSMTVGYKCLMKSAELAGLDEVVERPAEGEKKDDGWVRVTGETDAAPAEEPAATEEKPEEKKEEEKKLPGWVTTLTMVASVVLSLAIAIGVFVMLPTFLYGLLPIRDTGSAGLNSLIKSAFEGVIKIALLVGYMAAISLMKDIRRTFMYHGAEHKTIFCYEKGLPLTVENVRPQSRFHPRCGTSFLFVVVIISILVFSLVSLRVGLWDNPWVRIGLRLLLLPVVVSISYEINRWVGRHDNLCSRILSAPGKWLQRLTTNEPDDSMIECAIRALELVIPEQKGSDAW